MEVPICKVCVTVNPTLSTRYNIRTDINTGDIRIDIQIQSGLELCSVANLIRDSLCIKKKYRVIFNFKSAPAGVRNNSEFRYLIQKIFQVSAGVVTGSDPLNAVNAAEIVRSHMNTYGHYPDMRKRTSKKLTNIHNYIISVLNSPVSIEFATQIEDILSD